MCLGGSNTSDQALCEALREVGGLCLLTFAISAENRQRDKGLLF